MPFAVFNGDVGIGCNLADSGFVPEFQLVAGS